MIENNNSCILPAPHRVSNGQHGLDTTTPVGGYGLAYYPGNAASQPTLVADQDHRLAHYEQIRLLFPCKAARYESTQRGKELGILSDGYGRLTERGWLPLRSR